MAGNDLNYGKKGWCFGYFLIFFLLFMLLVVYVYNSNMNEVPLVK
jgi:ABC-type multidrug transport system permease subunit